MINYIVGYLVVLLALGTAVSNYFLWKHISEIRKNLGAMFKGKSSDDFYNFVHGGSSVNVSNANVDHVENES